MKNHVENLNLALHADDFDADAFSNLLQRIIKQENIRLRILDFEYFHETRLKHLTKEKLAAIQAKDYHAGALWRDKERKVLEYIEIKRELKIQQSGFLYDKGYLFYFHLGTARNDPAIKKLFQTLRNVAG